MTVILIIIIIAGLIYGFVFMLSLFVQSITPLDRTKDFLKTAKSKRIVFLISIICSILITSYYVFFNPAENLKTAYIEKKGDNYTITLFGKRNYMVHDPISALKKDTYLDSAKFEIPRANGIIDGLEIHSPGSYKILKGQAIIIKDKAIEIKLFYDNYDRETKDPSPWNGNYELKWR
jgi:hypothetical protein